MRKKLSFKGIIIGAVTDVVGTNIWGVIVVIYLVLNYHLASLPPPEMTSKITSLMMHEPMVVTLNYIIGGGFTVLGGYIAARIAKHNELLNGTLASFLCVIFTFFAIGSAPVLDIIIGVVSNPLLGLAGGYLCLMQKRPGNKKSSK